MNKEDAHSLVLGKHILRPRDLTLDHASLGIDIEKARRIRENQLPPLGKEALEERE